MYHLEMSIRTCQISVPSLFKYLILTFTKPSGDPDSIINYCQDHLTPSGYLTRHKQPSKTSVTADTLLYDGRSICTIMMIMIQKMTKVVDNTLFLSAAASYLSYQ
jgi:hypothetical protein